MSPSLTAGLPGGSRAGFTSGGIVLHVRGLTGYKSGLAQAGAATQLFGKSLILKDATGAQRVLLKAQRGFISLGNTIVKTGIIAAGAGIAISVGIGVAALKTAASVQQLTYALQGLVAIELGQEQSAKGLVLDMSQAMLDAIPIADSLVVALRDVALATPIQYEQVFAALRLQLAYGATAIATETFTARIKEAGLSMDKAIHPALAMAEAVAQVGAVLSRDAATFERLNYNLAQAIQKGILTAKNMRELKNAGLDLEEVFKEELNMTLKETDAAFKAGTISTEDMSVAFISFADKYFAPASKRMTRSLQGIINNFKDLWAFAATDAMTPMLEVITEKLGKMFDIAQKMLEEGQFKKIGEDIKNIVVDVIEFFEAIKTADIETAKFVIQVIGIGAAFIVVSSNLIKLANGLVALRAIFATTGAAGAAAGTAVTAAWLGPLIAIVAIVAAFAVVAKAIETSIKLNKIQSASLALSNETYDAYINRLEKARIGNYALSESIYDVIKARQALGKIDTEAELAEAVLVMNRYHDTLVVATKQSHLFADAEEGIAGRIAHIQGVVDEQIKGMDELTLSLIANTAEARRAGEAAGFREKWLDIYVKVSTKAAKQELHRIRIGGTLASITDKVIAAQIRQTIAMGKATGASQDLVASEEGQIEVLKQLEGALEKVTDLYEGWGNAISDVLLELQDIEEDAADAHRDYVKDIKGLNADLAKDMQKIAEKYDDSMPDATSEEKRAGSIIDVWDEWARRMQAIAEVGGPEENLEQEGGWVAEIQAMTAGTDFAMNENEENVSGWMLRLKDAFMAGDLPDEFYDKAKLTRGWTEHFAALDAERKEDERKLQEAADAKRLIAEQELADAKAAAEEERQDALVLGALSLAESTTALQQWAQATQGPMAAAYDTAQEVFDALEAGTLKLTPELAALIQNYAGGIVAVSGTAAGAAADTEAALDDVIAKAEDVAAKVPGLQAEYDNLKSLVEGPFAGEFDETEMDTMIARMAELEIQLQNMGLVGGAEFPTAVDDFQVAVEDIMGTLSTELATLGEENAAVALGMIEAAGEVATAWHDAMFENSVVPDTKDAMTESKTAWDALMLHMTTSMNATVTTIKGTWKTGVDALVTEIKRIAGAVTTLTDRINEIPTSVTVTITIKTVTSPASTLSHGIDKVNELAEALNSIPTDLGVEIAIDLPRAEQLGRTFGDLLVNAVSGFSKGGKKTGGRWWDFTKNLFEPGKRLAGLTDSFAKRWEDVELVKFQERLAEIDKLIQEGNVTEEQRNQLLEERLRLQDDMVRNEETMLAAEKARADIDFLKQQVDLLEIIRNHKLNAREILGDITLGIDASAAELMEVTTRALQAIVEQINQQLQIASPSKVMMDVGRFMMLGMGAGIESAAMIPVEAVTSQAIAPVIGASTGSIMNVAMNPTINNEMDMVVFENRVLDVVRRGVRGY